MNAVETQMQQEIPAEQLASAQQDQSEEEGGLLDAEDLLLMGFALEDEEGQAELVKHFMQFGDIASFSPLEGVTGSVVLIGYKEDEDKFPGKSAAVMAQEAAACQMGPGFDAPALVVGEGESARKVVCMQHQDFLNGALASDTPHEIAISGFAEGMTDDHFAELKGQIDALVGRAVSEEDQTPLSQVVSWQVHTLATGQQIVRLAMSNIEGVIEMFRFPFTYQDRHLFLLSEDHLSLAPQAHIVVFGGFKDSDPTEDDLNKLKAYFTQFGDIAQMFVRNEAEGLMLLISYMSEEAIYRLGECEKHEPLGDPLMIQCVKSDVFDKLCSDDFQFDMEEAQDRIIVIKGLPQANSTLEKEVFEPLCDSLKEALEKIGAEANPENPVHVVKIDMEPTYGLSVIEFFATEEAQAMCALQQITFQNDQFPDHAGTYNVMAFKDFMLDEALPEGARKAQDVVEGEEQVQQNLD